MWTVSYEKICCGLQVEKKAKSHLVELIVVVGVSGKQTSWGDRKKMKRYFSMISDKRVIFIKFSHSKPAKISSIYAFNFSLRESRF